MRLISLALAAAATVATLASTTTASEAFDRRETYRLHSWADPYRYQYEPRGYYPYYSSSYWRPRAEVRKRFDLKRPRYYRAWGKYKPSWQHRDWHAENHGRHRFWHW